MEEKLSGSEEVQRTHELDAKIDSLVWLAVRCEEPSGLDNTDHESDQRHLRLAGGTPVLRNVHGANVGCSEVFVSPGCLGRHVSESIPIRGVISKVEQFLDSSGQKR